MANSTNHTHITATLTLRHHPSTPQHHTTYITPPYVTIPPYEPQHHSHVFELDMEETEGRGQRTCLPPNFGGGGDDPGATRLSTSWQHGIRIVTESENIKNF
ncbi:hypothetical protein Hamer_G009058 [Homarus americanus]|uniref:Uncharacterized protein n=1 Tax=Homarus americanus TaxID=6706 RepID=A0A8J5NBN0_HOMAM|nr:hypothetical protein Hamer_G009058 [Homarus americanus]